jgi:hypothetical protein
MDDATIQALVQTSENAQQTKFVDKAFGPGPMAPLPATRAHRVLDRGFVYFREFIFPDAE